MKYLLFPLRFLYVIYTLALFVAIMFILFPFFIVASWGGPVRGANYMIRLCTAWADCWMFLVGMPHRNIFEVSHDFKKPYIYVANHGGSTNSIDLWWETGGVDQMYFFDGTSIGGGNKEILGGQSEAPIFVLHNGDTVKAQASSSGDIEIAFTFKLIDQPQSFVNFNGS